MHTRLIEVVPYDPSWPAEFERLRAHLAPALAPYIHAIEHVGSTSVPGLAAKPILDADIVLRSAEDFAPVKAALSDLGYAHAGDLGIEGREAFHYEGATGLMAHHLYACAQGARELKRHLALRDYLRAHADARDAYGELKHLAALRHPHDIDRYIALKGPFIEAVYRASGLLPMPAPSAGELWDLYDEGRRPLGKTVERASKRGMGSGEYHIVVEVWALSPRGEVLLTLRDPNKNDFANTWENTGGSLLAGESSRRGAARELFEETGLSVSPETLHPLGSLRERSAFVDSYLVLVDVELDDLRFQAGETVFARWASVQALDEIIAQGRLAAPTAERWSLVRKTAAQLFGS